MTPTPQHFVAIVDDDNVTRELIFLTLESLQIPVVAFPDAQAFLDHAHWRHCACLVLDVRMPRMSGTELQRMVKHEGMQIPIIFMTAHADVRLVVTAMRDGAVDFLQKPVDLHELVERVQRCLRDAEQQRANHQGKDVLRARLACLTPREREVFDQIVAGRRSKQIAAVMGVSLKTVEEYRSKVLHKMHVSSTPELLSQVSPMLRTVTEGR